MALPLNLDDLVTAVIEANSNTVVVVQAGTPISMPWLSSANALVHAWYGGNETGNAIADVVFGLVNPSAKLPLTFPVTVEDNPTFLNFRSERGRVLYGEDIYIGYRYYERLRKAVAFPFGHGLSYTSFAFSNLEVSVDEEKDDLLVSVTLSNTGSCDGAEVVQVYIQHISPAISRPVKELKGFKKVTLKKGEHCKVNVSVQLKYATSYWDELDDQWVSEEGKYKVLVGSSSDKIEAEGSFDVNDTKVWRGL